MERPRLQQDAPSRAGAGALQLGEGLPWPLGMSVVAAGGGGGLNFAVWAPDATAIELCLFDDSGLEERARLRLPGFSEGVWHGFLPAARPGLVYGLRAHGPWAPHAGHWFNPAKLLLDPWAQEVIGHYGRPRSGAAGDPDLESALGCFPAFRADAPQLPDERDNAAFAPKARVPLPLAHTAPRPPRPRIAREHCVLYEAHVRALTMRHPGVAPALRGSYAALADPAMLEHYRTLGVTTLCLLPLHFRADEAALQRRGLVNHWGYTPIAWLAPESRYWSGRPGTTPAGELCAAIDALHGAGLEVVLDVVFNHSAELDASGPMLSLRGLANARAYHLVPGNAARYQDWTGCGNAVNLAEPRMVELVLGALRHWATVYRVDGFRFDLATTLGRSRHGGFERDAGLFAALQADPALAGLKLIAEPWDIGPGGYQLGAFPAGWLEWNDQFRDTLRAWWLRGSGDRGTFAHRFAGSAAQFDRNRRSPTASVNFLCAHDGFTLRDLVSHDHKHNHANGEHGHDGQHHNASWNCGVEGPSDDPDVLALRARLQRALLATLLCAQGTPMLLAGDEIGHSQQGNNNAYCQDNDITWVNWAQADHALLACVRRLLALRAALPALRHTDWLRGAEQGDTPTVAWLGPDGLPLQAADWNTHDIRALAILLHPSRDLAAATDRPQHGSSYPAAASEGAAETSVLILLNPDTEGCRFTPPPGCWHAVFDSAEQDGAPRSVPALPAPPATITLSARSVRVFTDRALADPALTRSATLSATLSAPARPDGGSSTPSVGRQAPHGQHRPTDPQSPSFSPSSAIRP
ncbi:MAG: glycogen debranching protein GlgX [Thauera sp.]